MSIESKVSGHWTDEQLIEHLYGVGPRDGHIGECSHCHARLSAMQAQRRASESASARDDVGFEFLAGQRRRIYAKIAAPANAWSPVRVRRWASAAAGLLVLAGGLLLVENNNRPLVAPNSISDAQLSQDVSRMAEDPEPPATAPLQALFEE